jgi:Pyridoxamine 5'-phosphate oxidase
MRPRPLRCAVVATWKELVEAEPELAGRVRRLFDAGRHKTLATLRADGSPRISGIECEFTDDDLRFGSMSGARKGADLRRDPRFALHGPSFHPVEGQEAAWPGEAKIAGRAIAAGAATSDDPDQQPDGEMFVADITEVAITALNAEATKLVVEWWTPAGGRHRLERD